MGFEGFGGAGRGLSKSFISRVIIGVTPFRVLITLLTTYLLSPLPLQVVTTMHGVIVEIKAQDPVPAPQSPQRAFQEPDLRRAMPRKNNLEFRVQGLGFRVQGLGFRV